MIQVNETLIKQIITESINSDYQGSNSVIEYQLECNYCFGRTSIIGDDDIDNFIN